MLILLALLLVECCCAKRISLQEVIEGDMKLDYDDVKANVDHWRRSIRETRMQINSFSFGHKMSYNERQSSCGQQLASKKISCNDRVGAKKALGNLSDCSQQLISTEARLAVFIANETVNQTAILDQIGDTLHQRTIAASRGMYTNETFEKFDMESMIAFADVLGSCFNFIGQPYIPDLAGIGGYMSPCNNVILLPYVIDLNETKDDEEQYLCSVMFDSDHLEQGESDNRWRVLPNGNFALVIGPNVSTPQGTFFQNQVLGYGNYVQVNLDCPEWDANDPDCVINNLAIPPTFSVPVDDTPYTSFPNFTLAFSALTWENDCCERGTGTNNAYLQGPDFDNLGPLRKYQITQLILPNQCS